jgi:hypothetical protein
VLVCYEMGIGFTSSSQASGPNVDTEVHIGKIHDLGSRSGVLRFRPGHGFES